MRIMFYINNKIEQKNHNEHTEKLEILDRPIFLLLKKLL